MGHLLKLMAYIEQKYSGVHIHENIAPEKSQCLAVHLFCCFSVLRKYWWWAHTLVCLCVDPAGTKQRELPGAVPRGRPVPPPRLRGGRGGLPGGAPVWAEPEQAGRGPAAALPPPQGGAEERPPHLSERGGDMEGTRRVSVFACVFVVTGGPCR